MGDDSKASRLLVSTWEFQKRVAKLQCVVPPTEPENAAFLFKGPLAQKKIDAAKNEALAWRNRALMARKQSDEGLVNQALGYMWRFQTQVAKMQGKEPPDRPADIPLSLFDEDDSDPPWRPYDPSRVPKVPLPSSGAGEVALPLPEEDWDTQ